MTKEVGDRCLLVTADLSRLSENATFIYNGTIQKKGGYPNLLFCTECGVAYIKPSY